MISLYLQKKIIDHYIKRTSAIGATMPTNVYVALYLDHPESVGAEVTGSGYARKASGLWSNKTSSAIDDGIAWNSAALTFGPAGADWGRIRYIGLTDALTSGNLLFYGPITPSFEIVSGQSYTVNANALIVSLAP